ncbi:hypothetical protein [Bacillus cereus]|uniref:hypothetical protein n=1 Tax=Bacillus cereus TaxID=1396 RepID=UPI000993454F|nr:hypothetical protein [Bacillus cereus]OOQ92175.1 hypothetical protein BW898_25315 [Bacillus cereus]
MKKVEKMLKLLSKVAIKTSPYVTGGIWLLFGYANILGAYICHKMEMYYFSYSIVAFVCVALGYRINKSFKEKSNKE